MDILETENGMSELLKCSLVGSHKVRGMVVMGTENLESD